MPDPTITARDPFQRAKADADAKYGSRPLLAPTLSVLLASGMMALVAASLLGGGTGLARALMALAVVNGLATLVAYLHEARRLKRRSRLIDQRWQMLRAEAARLREVRPMAWPTVPREGRG